MASGLWSRAGNLKQSRAAHGVVLVGSTFLVVGGTDDIKTENCVLEGSVMKCIEQDSPPVPQYAAFFPSLFVINNDDDYGDEC